MGPCPSIAMMLVSLLLTGCVSIPTTEFNGYLASFNQAKSSSEELILNAGIAAETVANSDTIPGSPSERAKKLTERQKALDARLEALELVSSYNQILVSLASGADPKSIQTQVEGLRDGLSSFGFSKLTALVGRASPYTKLIGDAVAAIDGLIKKKKFKEAVDTGQEPILGILAVLHEDADNIQEIQTQLLLVNLDPEEANIAKLRARLQLLVSQFKASAELEREVARFNDALKKLEDNQTAQIDPAGATGSSPASPFDIVVMQSIVDDVVKAIEACNRTREVVKAHRKVIEEYKGLLAATSSAFQRLDAAIKTNQRAAVVGFVQQGLSLRQAVLELQNAKSQ